jgi:hypothetical protein
LKSFCIGLYASLNQESDPISSSYGSSTILAPTWIPSQDQARKVADSACMLSCCCAVFCNCSAVY